MTLKLNDAKKLVDYVDALFEETTRSVMARRAVQEREKQAAAAHSSSSGKLDEDEKGGQKQQEKTQGAVPSGQDASKTLQDDLNKLEKGDVTTDDIVNKLNSIRAGKSFRDEEINKSLDQYVNSLKKAEKVALLAFLTGISQLVTGLVSSDQAEDPAEPPSNVKMKKVDKDEKQVRQVKPVVIKAKIPQKKEKSVEDTSAPITPVAPKK